MPSTGVLLIGLGFLLFFFGLIQCLTSRKFLGYLFGIEIIINAANINLIGFLQFQQNHTDFQPMIAMIIAFAVIETVVGLSIFTWATKATGTNPALSLI